MTHRNENVLIVGAGPTGLTAALVLAKRGFKPRIIDKKNQPIVNSNALGIQPRTLELWTELGIIRDALSQGHPLKGITLSTEVKLLGKTTFEDLPTRHPFLLVLPQAKTESLLTAHLAQYGVAVERGVQFESLTENEEGVLAVCNGSSNLYSYILGCDGAKSDVRREARITTQGYDLPQHFIMADIHIAWDRDPREGHVFYSDEGPIVFFPMDDRGFGRLIIDVSTDERLYTATHPTLEDFQEKMAKRCRVPATLYDPSWISTFWIHCRLADSYTKGRAFIAGDAAHQHSPVGGQGLNTGVQDAYFLANLLADVFEGKKSRSELENYEIIRRPIGKKVVRRTALLTKIATTRSRPLQTMRNMAAQFLLRVPPIRRKAMMNFSQLDHCNKKILD